MTSTHDNASGIPKGKDMTETFFRQKTTSIPIMAYGSTEPRYVIYAGVFCPLPNMINGVILKAIVTKAETAMISIVCSEFTVSHLLFFRFTRSRSNCVFIKFTTQYSQDHGYTYHSGYQKFISTENKEADCG